MDKEMMQLREKMRRKVELQLRGTQRDSTDISYH